MAKVTMVFEDSGDERVSVKLHFEPKLDISSDDLTEAQETVMDILEFLADVSDEMLFKVGNNDAR